MLSSISLKIYMNMSDVVIALPSAFFITVCVLLIREFQLLLKSKDFQQLYNRLYVEVAERYKARIMPPSDMEYGLFSIVSQEKLAKYILYPNQVTMKRLDDYGVLVKRYFLYRRLLFVGVVLSVPIAFFIYVWFESI